MIFHSLISCSLIWYQWSKNSLLPLTLALSSSFSFLIILWSTTTFSPWMTLPILCSFNNQIILVSCWCLNLSLVRITLLGATLCVSHSQWRTSFLFVDGSLPASDAKENPVHHQIWLCTNNMVISWLHQLYILKSPKIWHYNTSVLKRLITYAWVL